jgi:hypothetical protein
MYKKYKVGIHNHNILKTGENATNKVSDMLQILIMGVNKFFLCKKVYIY